MGSRTCFLVGNMAVKIWATQWWSVWRVIAMHYILISDPVQLGSPSTFLGISEGFPLKMVGYGSNLSRGGPGASLGACLCLL